MEFGAHLPIIDFDGRPWSLRRLTGFATTARRLGFRYLCVNDHLIWPRPWLDSLTALAAVLEASAPLTLVTSIALPVVRGPVVLAKGLAALDVLSGGRLIVGVGPGSSPRDYTAVGIPFEERWPRFDETVRVLRALLARGRPGFQGRFYSPGNIVLEPRPAQEPGPAIWIGSWGSEAGLRRVARLGDGWLASGYNTTSERFDAAWRRLQEMLRAGGKDPENFPNGISTMYCYISEDRRAADDFLKNILAPALNRPVEALETQLLFGPAEACAETLRAYREAGAQRVFLWPVIDEEAQLELLMERVAPRLFRGG